MRAKFNEKQNCKETLGCRGLKMLTTDHRLRCCLGWTSVYYSSSDEMQGSTKPKSPNFFFLSDIVLDLSHQCCPLRIQLQIKPASWPETRVSSRRATLCPDMSAVSQWYLDRAASHLTQQLCSLSHCSTSKSTIVTSGYVEAPWYKANITESKGNLDFVGLIYHCLK